MIKEILNIFKSDSLMDRAFKRSYEMLEITNQMFKDSKRVLRETDSGQLNLDINDQDFIINKFQREVRKDVFNHLAMSGNTELPSGMVLASIVIDLERIGDFTKNIVEIAQNHPQRLHAGDFENDLLELEKAVEDSFGKTIHCFKNSDEKAAFNLLKEYKWVSRKFDAKIESLIRGEDTTLTSGSAVALAIYLRALKRIFSHLRNVTSSVVNPFHRIGFKPKKPKNIN
ncbi:MAG: PhoU domain-containing protein [Bacteroidetes bacterium]|nr:PhoU domain-containing protein [Bacteroidota bacterium]MBU1113837.1 PhoU domain-containing protein [Bacteroidota bacterium]MBU1798205.1 PhoU domain-containing protein [Bacteroidota bacterium]